MYIYTTCVAQCLRRPTHNQYTYRVEPASRVRPSYKKLSALVKTMDVLTRERLRRDIRAIWL